MSVAKYKITRNFDFSPRPNVVRVFTQGEIRADLTRACIQKGKSLKALKPIKKDKD